MDKWIKCSDNLPEVKDRQGTIKESEYVLACDGMGVIHKALYRESINNFRLWVSDNLNALNDIKAWMPLPEPYKEVEHDRK